MNEAETRIYVQSGCCTGNREKLSNSPVFCLAQLCLAAAEFLSVSTSTLYTEHVGANAIRRE